jgi:hypothetical protein
VEGNGNEMPVYWCVIYYVNLNSVWIDDCLKGWLTVKVGRGGIRGGRGGGVRVATFACKQSSLFFITAVSCAFPSLVSMSYYY